MRPAPIARLGFPDDGENTRRMRVYFYIIISAILGLEPFTPLERALEKKLLSKIGGLESARVRIEASRFRFIVFGLCGRVTVEMRGLRIGNLRVESFRIESDRFRIAPFATFVLNRPRILNAGPTCWEMQVRDEDLESYFGDRGPLLRGVEVRIDPECVTMRRPSGLAALLGLGEPLSVCGRVVLGEKNELLLDLDHLQTFGIGPNRRLLNSALRIVNPILTSGEINRLLERAQIDPLERVALEASFEQIRMDTGHLDILGTIAAVPKKTQKGNRAGKTQKYG
jgi:hypothetical protein